MEKPVERDVIIYSYMKNGIICHTPNEQIAMMRSDNGEYYKEVLRNEEDVVDKNNLKETN